MNEAMALASMNPMVGGGTYMVNTMSDEDKQKDAWSNYFLAKTFDGGLIGVKDGKVTIKDSLSEDTLVTIYKVNRPDNELSDIYDKIMEDMQSGEIVSLDYIYETLTGHNLLTEDQLDYDPILEQIYLDKLSAVISGEAENVKGRFRDATTPRKSNKKGSIFYNPDDKISATPNSFNNMPLLASADIEEAKRVLKNKNHIAIYEDANGYYAYNLVTSDRTASFKSISDIVFEGVEV